jgi:hypothetical protein
MIKIKIRKDILDGVILILILILISLPALSAGALAA